MGETPTEGTSELQPRHYRHPAEFPRMVASLWLAIAAVAVCELAMVATIAMPAGPVRGVTLVVGIATLVWFHGGLVWGAIRVGAHLRAWREAGTRVNEQRHRDVAEAAEDVARALGMGSIPEVYVTAEAGTRVVALGVGRPAVFVGEQVLAEVLDPLELRALIARELGHIAAGHVRLRTLFVMPMTERIAHPALTAPLEIVWATMRWWWQVAEWTADRAGAIAAGGPEPLGHAMSRLACADAGVSLEAEQTLRQYCDDLFAGHPVRQPRPGGRLLLDAGRMDPLVRFAQSQKFGNCLALTGRLNMPVQTSAADPDRAGWRPYAVAGALALVHLVYVAALATVVLGGPRGAETTDQSAIASEPFDPTREMQRPAPREAPAAAANAGGDVEQGLMDLAKMHKDRGEYTRARRTLEDLILTNPLNTEAHYVLGWVCIEMGDNKMAEAEFTATVNLTSSDSDMHKEAQAALARLGR